MFQKRQVPLKIKEISESGEFSGYASVFDVIDSYGDVVVKGAFTRTIAEHEEAGTQPKLLLQHNSSEIVGEHTLMKEDDHGLYIEGILYKDDKAIPEAAKAYSLVKRKQLTGVSIGFSLYENGETYDQERGIWLLTAIKLWENSFVTFAANPEARVESVKSALRRGDKPSPSQFERALREMGLSTSQAKRFMVDGYKTLDDNYELTQSLDNLLSKIKST